MAKAWIAAVHQVARETGARVRGPAEPPTQLRNKDMSMELTDNAKRYLAKKGFDPVLGARPLRRPVQRELEDSLAERILFNELKPGQIVICDCDGDPDAGGATLVFRTADRPVPALEPQRT